MYQQVMTGCYRFHDMLLERLFEIGRAGDNGVVNQRPWLLQRFPASECGRKSRKLASVIGNRLSCRTGRKNPGREFMAALFLT